jgi:hypothetical protein
MGDVKEQHSMVALILEEIAMSELYVRWLPLAAPILSLLCLAVVAPSGARAAAGGADASAEPILEAAQRFLETLSPEQRERAVMAFDDERREDWHFIPKPQRKGLVLKDMTPEQMHMAHVLLSASLSQRGYAKATTIMSLDALLKQIEQEAGFTQMLSLRDPLFYYVTIFGEPAAGAAWGWSLEGHHVSVNFTLVGNRVASSPTFLGSNPHLAPPGPRGGLRILGREEDLGRALVVSLDASQRAKAILTDVAPNDIVTAAERIVHPDEPPKGLPSTAMTPEQQAALRALIEVYVENVPADLQAKRRAQYEGADFSKIFFAWMGSTEKGIGTSHGHYYRVQAPTFLIEYDNVQNQANHSHTVWRDYDGDFGRDLIGEHRAAVKH